MSVNTVSYKLTALFSFFFLGVSNAFFIPLANAGASSYTLFESGQVRPLALSSDGERLFVLNTPDNRLEAYKVTDKGLKHKGSVSVGLEPVALAMRSNNEVWVVNNVSDSVSIVDVDNLKKMYVKRTLLVGDEPMDIVFAGPGKNRAFITTAHRGQNAPTDPQLTTPGVGRADVWVFNANHLGKKSLGGEPLNIITLFTDSPRALAVSADGKTVYAAGFKTGNQTTTITEVSVSSNGGVPRADAFVDTNGDGILEPHMTNAEGVVQPLTSLIVKFNGEHWVDEDNNVWDDLVKFNLPDKDVFVIDAMANPPVAVGGDAGVYTSVGTILFNMAVNPVSGKIYVSNTEALNQNRFTGPGIKEGTTLKGHFFDSRITVLGDEVTPINLNKHIDYSTCCAPVPNPENAKSLAQPGDMVVSRDGQTLYVAAFGSGKIGVFDTEQLENDTFVPDTANQVQLSAGGPAGIVLDETRGRLYVLTRFDNGISVVDTDSKSEVAHLTMYNPEPQHIVDGRRYQYDAALTSSHGDSSCGLCHVFGDMDQLAWDLGNPDGSELNNPGPLAINHEDFGLPVNPHFAPVKGPMTTQSLRGMANHGPLHWRGDQTGGNEEVSTQPDSGIYNERLGFAKFNGAFVDLHGRDSQIDDEAMGEYTDFAMELMYPPNPIRNLDNSLTPDQQAGSDFYFNPLMVVDTAFHCNGCHIVDREGNAEFGVDKPGFFGTDGSNTFAFIQQFLKIPHMRNQYQKVGMFGMPNNAKYLSDDPFTGLSPDMNFEEFFGHVFFGNPNQHQGDQVRGFGYTHDGSTDTVFRFHNVIGFLPRPPGTVTPTDPGNGFNLDITPAAMITRRQLEQFVLVFDSNFFPVMGQQVTLTKKNAMTAGPRIDLLIARADLGECDLVARKSDKGFLYQGDGIFLRSKSNKAPISDAKLRSKAENKEKAVTYTCVPPGSGMRIALDRDEDGFLDGDEKAAGSDPADPHSIPAS